MADFLKGVLVALIVVLYVVSPDFFPGPIDDLVVIIFGIMSTVGSSGRKYIND